MAQSVTAAEPRPTILEWKGTDVDLASVEVHLSDLWKQLVRESGATGPVRTHIFNLVVYAHTDADLDRIQQSLSDLKDRQPSRTIILHGRRAEDQTAIDAAARVTCVPGSGGRPARSFERMTITARGRAADHLDSVVVPLLMPELRTYLWWPGQPPFGHRSFHRLLGFADQLIVDSAQFTSPGDGLADLARLSAGRQGVNDFHWARLRAWRDIITQFFDGPHLAPYARNIQSIELEYGAGGEGAIHQFATAGLLLLLGWAGRAFGWEPETTLESLLTHDVQLSVLQDDRLIPIDARFRDHATESEGRLVRCTLHCGGRGMKPAEFTVERMPDMQNAKGSMKIGDDHPVERVVPLTFASDIELLIDELETTGHDAIYDSSVREASRMAGRVLWLPA